MKLTFDHHQIVKANSSLFEKCSGPCKVVTLEPWKAALSANEKLHTVCLRHSQYISRSLKEQSSFSLSWFQQKLRLCLNVQKTQRVVQLWLALNGLHLKAVGLLHSVSVQKEMGAESLNIMLYECQVAVCLQQQLSPAIKLPIAEYFLLHSVLFFLLCSPCLDPVYLCKSLCVYITLTVFFPLLWHGSEAVCMLFQY